MGKIKLNVLGISYSQTQSGAYALVLTEENGERRIPIIVGGFEAQSIAIQLEGLNPPRPLTHDLFLNFARSFKIALLEVTIHKLEEGVFYSKLTCDDGKNRITIDSRTSDAIALALRFKCPIYTTDEIMEKAGIVLDFDRKPKGLPALVKNVFLKIFPKPNLKVKRVTNSGKWMFRNSGILWKMQ
jgi:bifunctional DNase/RNase